MTISLLCIGDELLDGRIQDTNARDFGGMLAEKGKQLWETRFVPDDEERIVLTLQQMCHTADFILVSGGLGPTEDDLTREAAGLLLERPMLFDEDDFARIERRMKERNRVATPNNRRQAHFPEGASIIPNENGTASGFQIEHEETRIIFVPGVPREFRWYVEEYVLDAFGIKETERITRAMRFFGLGESALEHRLDGMEELIRGSDVKTSYLAQFPYIRLTFKTNDEDKLAQLEDFVKARAGAWYVGNAEAEMARYVGDLLCGVGATVTTAESCTGGGIARELTSVSGSSAWFERAYVTYANDAKEEMVGVNHETLLAHGAVSKEVVMEMAMGALRKAGSEYALAVSGVAGPGGGSERKPVGTVHFGLATSQGVWHQKIWFARKNREQVRNGSIAAALSLLIWHIRGELREGSAHKEEHGITGPYDVEETKR